MIIKVCGMRNPENISAVAALGIDLLGLIFYPDSPRYVQEYIPSNAGILPDGIPTSMKEVTHGMFPKRVGVFVDEMPQTIITKAYNYELDYIQLVRTSAVPLIPTSGKGSRSSRPSAFVNPRMSAFTRNMKGQWTCSSSIRNVRRSAVAGHSSTGPCWIDMTGRLLSS